ncbi:aldehyde dehydrogenase family protein [Streptomyces sp. SID5770]|uniref:aldehyde dehydrogenase (NADP(+)) n=1 Tax=Streptomyces sp. SID5770 TaxID=2690308 RepID=UPI0013715378|nr:aldehyde dehydrogenase (NADP(+)) [Streptomyces sp. SID5770]MZE55810.1 aldehyde dehydrogenase family protein [Streptomyces sp. SID5770]
MPSPTQAPVPSPDGTPATHHTAADAAARAREAAPALAGLALPARASLLRDLSRTLGENATHLTAVAEDETRLGVERLRGEIRRTQVQLEMFADVVEAGAFLDVMIDPADPAAQPAPRPDVRRMLVPLGPVAVFSASNFPFAFSVLGGDTASALAAGCPVVVKAHTGHPRLSDLTAGLAAEVLPPGVLSVVHGRETGRSLVTDPAVRAVGFTGSTSGGRALFDLANSRPDPIPFYGELGSLNPVVVTPAACASRGAALVREYIASVTLGQGQFCTKPGLLFLPAGHGLDDHLRREIAAAPPAAMLGPWISTAYRTTLGELAAHPAVRPLHLVEQPDDPRAGAPALLTTTAEEVRACPELLEECFGPASLVITYASHQDLLDTLHMLPAGLTATLHCEEQEDENLAQRLISGVQAGRLIGNGWPTGVAVTPAMHHGGPWPATTSPLHTSVGSRAVARWMRPVAYQNMPDALLPAPLRRANPWNVPQEVADGDSGHAHK